MSELLEMEDGSGIQQSSDEVFRVKRFYVGIGIEVWLKVAASQSRVEAM